VRIKSFTEEPANVTAYGKVSDEAGARSFVLEPIGASGGAILARIDGIGDREAAEGLAGTRLYVPRSALPAPDDEEYYRPPSAVHGWRAAWNRDLRASDR